MMNGSLFTSPKRSQKIERFWGIFSHCVFFYLVGLVLMTGFVCHWYYYCGKAAPRFVLFVCVLEKILVRTSRQYKSYRHVCFFSSSWFLQQKFAYYVPKPQIFMATERPMNNNIKTNTISWILVTIKVLLPEVIKTRPILSKFGENEVIFFLARQWCGHHCLLAAALYLISHSCFVLKIVWIFLTSHFQGFRVFFLVRTQTWVN